MPAGAMQRPCHPVLSSGPRPGARPVAVPPTFTTGNSVGSAGVPPAVWGILPHTRERRGPAGCVGHPAAHQGAPASRRLCEASCRTLFSPYAVNVHLFATATLPPPHPMVCAVPSHVFVMKRSAARAHSIRPEIQQFLSTGDISPHSAFPAWLADHGGLEPFHEQSPRRSARPGCICP
jgi:hypothetical protein